jgi:hypothetical protein
MILMNLMMNFNLILYGVIGYLVYDLFLKGKSEGDEFDESFGQISGLSYPLYAYKEMTTKLLNAMHGNGTDEEPIYDVFRTIRTNADAIELKKEFGLRAYTGDFIGSFGLLINDEVPLTTWLDNELDDSEKSKIRTILKNNNVTEYFV